MLDHSSQSISREWLPTIALSAPQSSFSALPEAAPIDSFVRPSPELWKIFLVIGFGGTLMLLFAALWYPSLVVADLIVSGGLLARIAIEHRPARPAEARWVPPAILIQPVLSLRRALMRLADLMVPPELPLFERSAGIVRTELLRVAAKLKIADMLEDGPLSVEVLAARTRSNVGALSRVLRGLVSVGVFSFRKGRFQNNRLSLALRSKAYGSFGAFAHYFGSEANVQAWARLEQTVATGGSAFADVHGMDVWTWFDQHPQERQLFASAMSSMTQLEAPSLAASACFDGLARVCDVAGSEGILLAEVMKRRPKMEGILFEREGVISSAERFLRARNLSDRAQAIGGDFFQRLPDGCDGYLMKNVLHDFDDRGALQVLKVCRDAMKAGAKLFVIEMLADGSERNEVVSVSDLQMITVCKGGRQRSRREFEALFAEAGLQLRAVHSTASLSKIVEGVAI